MNYKIEILSELIRKRLKESLPGFEYQRLMSPEHRKFSADNHPVKKAAVLILLFPLNEVIHMAFIKRTRYNGPHSGQISLPGGMFEEKDLNLSNTALRECMEEIGIHQEDIHLLGNLSDLYIPVSDSEVLPFVGYTKICPSFIINKKEVQRMILVPLSHLLDKRNNSVEYHEFENQRYKIPFFNYKDDKIWGATAMILSEFLRTIEELEPDLSSPQC